MQTYSESLTRVKARRCPISAAPPIYGWPDSTWSGHIERVWIWMTVHPSHTVGLVPPDRRPCEASGGFNACDVIGSP